VIRGEEASVFELENLRGLRLLIILGKMDVGRRRDPKLSGRDAAAHTNADRSGNSAAR
jgi:hypothetical protein